LDGWQVVLRFVTGLTGAIIALESLALFVGTHLVSRSTEWAVPKNTVFILLDVVGGAGLIWIALKSRSDPFPPVFYFLGTVLILTHAYREWEYLVGTERAFCANLPLFVFNNIRLLGLGAATFLALVQRES
jgi:hypothetical protein